MNAHWLLIFPPVDYSPPRNPFYEIGYTAARLRSLGMQTTFLDLNLEFFEHHLDPVRLDRAIADRPSDRGSHSGPQLDAVGRARSSLEESLALVRGRTSQPPSFEIFQRAIADLELLLTCYDTGNRGETVGFDHYLPGVRLPETRRLLAAIAADRGSMMWRFLQARLSAEPPPDDVEMAVIWINNYYQLYGGLLLGAELRRLIPDSKICVVGNLLGRNIKALTRHPELAKYLDALVGSEPEAALPDALAWARGELSGGRFPNGGVFEGGRFVPSTTTVITNLDELETPEFPSLLEQRYFYPVPLLEIIGSRGCSHGRCAFCDDMGFGGYNKAPHRARAAHIVVRDLERLARQHGCRAFSFWDANLSGDFLDSLSTAVEESSIEVIWSGHTRTDTAADLDRCMRVSRAGCRLLNFGFESASQRILDLMGKGQSIETIRTALEHCRDAGISVHGSFIQGFPTETEEELRSTADFIEENRKLFASFHVYDFQLSKHSTMARRPGPFGIDVVPWEDGDIDVLCRFRRTETPRRTNELLLDGVRQRYPEMTLDRTLYDIHCAAYLPRGSRPERIDAKESAP
jgi:anaerobic magnesium-protoporphyrin IX monomethyl ester cyclase